ncbi:MAG: selenide, water dikinase SelD [Sulfuricurvum sp.]|uniref:selenide, water dikinase SelD n=1 Tax=Sulfuricurvum sp. TaxID=2025608 RepID=UPI0025EB3F80|nr:selenide, water dikinase SelD [Sulfuricurvum sp.]MCK9372987.1 selenide, water dikinase SelD [Sulfuricurvum sp.]
MNNSAQLTKFVRASGCAAKLSPGSLEDVTCHLKSFHKDLIVGFEGNEDAGVYRIDQNLAIVQTVDFITPVVDDPFIYGQIAAANSLSDVFAMGGDPKTALNVVGFDGKNQNTEVLNEILRGGASKVHECGAVIVGGHTIETPEMIYGLSCTGFVHPDAILRNNTVREGDLIVLTKPLGLGILITAIKADLLDDATTMRVAETMRTLNYKASLIAREFHAHACTDVTGFGFLGHLKEMGGKNHTIEVEAAAVPLFSEALEMAAMGIIPAGSYANKEYLESKVRFTRTIGPDLEMILFDAQTSGGLLISATAENARRIAQRCIEEGVPASIVAQVITKTDADIIVR